MTLCPCHSKKDYADCCGIYISGKQIPPTPESLMRSRYAAYTRANIDYIKKTMKGKAAKNFNAREALQWAKQAEWLGLEILNISPLKQNGKLGYVEFIARFSLQGRMQQIHEVSEFQFKNNRWYYTDGRHVKK